MAVGKSLILLCSEIVVGLDRAEVKLVEWSTDAEVCMGTIRTPGKSPL